VRVVEEAMGGDDQMHVLFERSRLSHRVMRIVGEAYEVGGAS
jgi:hypothetical protein